MRRAGLIALLAVVVCGLLAVTLVGASDKRSLAFTLGVPPAAPVVTMRPGRTICQGPVDAAAAFDAVELQPGTFARPGQPLELVVRRSGDERQLARATIPAGYADFRRLTVDLGAVAPGGGQVDVCLTNEGRSPIALYGAADGAARTSTATLDGRPTGFDVDLVFLTDSRSTLAQIPDMLDRMALFHGGWIGPWLYWLLLAGVVVGAPALLWRALSGALAESDPRARDDAPR